MKRIRVLPLSAGFLLAFVLVAAACGGGGGGNPFGVESELVTDAAQADALAFAPDGRLFYAEHWTGNIRVMTADGELLEDPFATVPDIAADIQTGLTGLALDPEFETNGFVYAYFTQIIDPSLPRSARPMVIRFTDSGNRGTDVKIIADDLPEVNSKSPFNSAGNVHFGPDGFLYVTDGDHDMPRKTGPQGDELPQDLGTTIGKILRIDKEDGSAPPDNPFFGETGADPRIFAYGFRSGFNFAVHPETNAIYGSDNSGTTCEELNIIEKGSDYGWPQVNETPFDCSAPEQIQPIHLFAREGMGPGDFDSTVGVSGMEFVSSKVYPLLGDSLLVCESRTQLMRRLVLAGANFDEVTEDDVIAKDCWLDVTTSPDGIVYYSNLKEIRRLVPSDVTTPTE